MFLFCENIQKKIKIPYGDIRGKLCMLVKVGIMDMVFTHVFDYKERSCSCEQPLIYFLITPSSKSAISAPV